MAAMARGRRAARKAAAAGPLPARTVVGPEMRAYLRLKVRAARKRVYCLPEQWVCGRCGTGLVLGVGPSGEQSYRHLCHRERADALLARVTAELRGDL